MTTTADLVLNYLAGFDLKKERGNNYRCNSPLRPGSNSHAFTLTLDDNEHGAYHDKVSGDSGSLYQLAEALGIPTPVRERTAESTKRAYRDLKDYAEAHALEDYMLTEAGWKQVTHSSGRPALAFTTRTGTRYRFLDGNKPYYISTSGYTACWYGLERAVEMARGYDTPLILCNGEISTITAQTYGLPAAAITGGEKRLPEGLLDQLQQAWNGDVWLAYDCDSTGQRVAREVAQQIGSRARIIALGLTDGADLADFIKLHADGNPSAAFWKLTAQPPAPLPTEQIASENAATLAQALRELRIGMAQQDALKEAQDLELQLSKAQAAIDAIRSKSAKPKVKSFSEVGAKARRILAERQANPSKIPGLKTGFTLLDKVIGGLQPGTVNIIYGATSMGKSTMAISMIRELIQQGAGLIIPTETPDYRYLFKLAASLCRIPSDLIDRGRLDAGQYRQVEAKICELEALGWDVLDTDNPSPEQLRAAFLDGAATRGYKVVVIDSVSNLATADDYGAVARINNTIQQLAKHTGIPVLMTSQVGRDLANRPAGQKRPRITDGYGGGVIENNADVVLGLYRHQYYVDQGTEQLDDNFPPDTAAGILLKNRNGGNVGKWFNFVFVGGSGFYQMEKRTDELF